MARTRLTVTHRDLLLTFAEENISCAAEQKVADKAYTRAAKLVGDAVRKNFPPSDMAILAKYEVAALDRCINGGSPDGRFVYFSFRDSDETAPMAPTRRCSTRAISFDARTTEAIDASDKARNVFDKAKSEKLKAYRALIQTARTFEDVVAVWPAAETLRGRIAAPSTALVALSDDVVQFIRSDNAGPAAPVLEAA